MDYSKLQKIISSFLLFIFFFGQIFGLSFFSLLSSSVYAENSDFHDLVSVIVTEDVYDELDDEIERYAEDIQAYLDNTKVVILPINNDTSSFQIASMNENLFYEGYKGLDNDINFESKLIGTVIIGEIDLPIIEDNLKTTKSVVPFVDFEDKQFIYNHTTKLFEKNRENFDGLKAEIFHGIISPNTGDSETNIEKIKDFLDKDHDFYSGKNLFDSEKEILNGKVGEENNANYEPFVFYFDQIREQKSLSYTEFKGYEAYLNNKEDLTYHRYSQDLNNKLQDDIDGARQTEIEQLLEGIEDEGILDAFKDTQGLDASSAPDISLRHVIDSSTNQFLEIFNKGTISDFRTNVHNAGRYNEGTSQVNVDMIPYLISILDNITDKSLKSANDDLEDYVFSKVFPEAVHVPIPVSIDSAESLPKKIASLNSSDSEPLEEDDGLISSFGVPIDFLLEIKDLSVNDIHFDEIYVNITDDSSQLGGYKIKRGVFGAILKITEFSIEGNNVKFKIESGENIEMKIDVFNKILNEYSSEYHNFYDGRPAEYLGGPDGGAGVPDSCTIFRGNTKNGGQLVELNHGFNPKNGTPDSELIFALGNACESGSTEEMTRGYWGGNSIINFSDTEGVNINLNYQRTDLAIEDLYDPLGSQKSENAGDNPSFFDCYEYNYLKTKEPITYNGDNLYEIPLELSMSEKLKRKEPSGWTCDTENINFKNTDQTSFGKIYVLSSLEGMLYTIGSTDGAGKSEVAYNGNDGVETAADCLVNGIELWYGAMGGERTLYKVSTYDGDTICPVTRYKYHFTSTEGYIKHNYPDNETLNNQIKNPGVPSLPINKDRYLEIFTGDMLKFPYPYLFRVTIDSEKDLEDDEIKNLYTIEGAKKALDIFLEEYDNSTGNILFVKDYVTSKADEVVMIGGEEKTFNYYDFLSFSVLWNNLPSISSKYKFVMQHYLSDQIEGNDFKFILPKNKKQYEVAYLGAHGDAQNMYVKIDPEDKIDTNPYSTIFARNSLLNSNKISFGVLNGTNKINYNMGDTNELPQVNYEEGLFKCAPPEGVPIREWIPAVICRFEGLLPVEISIGESNCSASTAFESDDDVDYYHLLGEQTEEQKDYEEDFDSADSDKNGLNDFCEGKITNNGSLSCSAGSSKYYFNKRGVLNTEVLDKDGKRIMLDNSSYITFSLEKIVDINTGETVFDKNVDNFKDKEEIINQYVDFNEFEVKSSYGESKYSFATKDKEADIYFVSNLDLRDNEQISVHKIKSNITIIKVRKNRLFLSSKKILKDKVTDFGKTILVNDKTNVYLYDEKNTEFDLTNINENSIVLGLLNIGNDSNNKNISFPLIIILRDKDNKIVEKEIINNLKDFKELYSIKKSGSYKIEITDNYGYKIETNIELLAGEPSNLKIDVGTTVLEKAGSISTNLISIYDEFNNIVTGKSYDFDLNILGDSIEFLDNNSKNLKLSTYEGYKAFRIKSLDETGISKIKIDLYDGELTSSKNIKVLNDFNINIKYSDSLKVGNNTYEADLEFVDSNNRIISDLNSRVYLSAGEEYIDLLEPYNNIINGKAKIKFKTKTLSGENKTLNFRVEGFNKVINKFVTILPEKPLGLSFTSTKTQLEADIYVESYINLELRDIYNNLVFTDSDSKITLEILDKYEKIIKSSDLEKQLSKGKVSFKINATELPGKAYLNFSIDKKLEENEFILGEGEKQIKINGASDNAILIETYFFYNKKSIEEKKYNSIYTTLLGAEYGDITQKDYLASAMIFDKENRSLAVTSLLNSPYNIRDAIKISDEGIISKTYDRTDLTQDVTINLKKDLNNNYYLDLFNSALNVYIGKIYLNFEDLNITNDIYNEISNSKEINLKELLNISEINIYSASNRIDLNNLLEKNKDSLIIYTDSSDYKLRDLYSKKANAKSIYYIDPFNTKFSLNSFSSSSLDTYDNFEKNKELGWSAGNKTLLAFAAGESVGDATKAYMGISLINIGDPIVSLKKIKKNSHSITKNFDSTIGKKLNKNEILGYRVFDYNADNLDDILLLEKNGLFSLLENTKTSKGFLDQKHLARVVDLGKVDFVSTGDFSGDKYEDIFFVDKEGKPFLINNNNKDFVRVDLTETFGLKGKIIGAKSFDMDNDSIDDIVILDDFGEINIFYGKTGTTNFTKNNVHSGYSMKLNSGIRNNMGAVYFDGLVQDVNKGSLTEISTDFRSVDILENLMFEKIAYDTKTNPELENYTKNTTFIKSEFASQVGIKVERTYKDINGGELKTGDIIEVELIIKNTTSGTLNNIVYLEDVPNYFDLLSDSIETDKPADIRGSIGYYKFFIDKFRLNSGSELKITYNVKTKALAYGNIKIGLFEKGEAGDDEYGDILISASKYNCGGDSDIFRSTDKRKYVKGIKVEICDESEFPEELSKNDLDEDENGIADYIDDLTPDDPQNVTEADLAIIQEYSVTAMEEYGEANKIEEETNIYKEIDNINDKIDDLSEGIDNLIEGFSCGFGGGGCFAMPINWAPLAPGNDISTPFGLIGDGLKIDEGIPVFSTLTGIQTSKGCIPSVWPISSLAYVPGPTCGTPSAGGYLGIWAPTNTFRFFITPTLTGGIGAAACFGGPAISAGNVPPIPVTPFIPYGNCVVAAMPLPNLCEDEEINSNPSSIGPVEYFGGGADGGSGGSGTGNNGYGVINGNCSEGSNHNPLPISNKINMSLAQEYLDYRNTGIPSSNLNSLVDESFGDISDTRIDYSSSLLQNQPLISINGGSVNNSDISISVDFSDDGNGVQFNAVEELRQERIAPFPRFITQWVNDQIEEFITKLVDFPTFFIILPDFSKIFNTDWGDYTDSITSGVKQTSGIKEAYEFLGNVPFVTIEGEPVNINIPQIDEATFEAMFTQRKLALESYPLQIQEAIESGKYSPESIISAKAFIRSLEMNIYILETYKDIPGAISKLAYKKQERLDQILCNIEAIEEVTGGWLGRNGKRFKAWVELYILIKAILKSWQALVDIFIDYDAECHECKNERWDSTQWEWTLISMIIPPIPVVQFPKWPDIVLDVHNIRLNLAVKLPYFKWNKKPIVLPPAPLLLLPDYKYIIPALEILPLLDIPELPDIPNLPTIKLPDLPPPPSLPKLWSSIEVFLKILKLIVKSMCILKKVPLVPEHRAGDQIAFLTEGGGYRGFDFIDKLMPNFSYPYLDEIRVTSYVNLEFETDFIVEMAKTIVSPVNDMTNDFSHMFDDKGIENINLGSIDLDTTNIAKKEVSSSEFLTLVNKELSKDSIINDPELEELRHSFDVVNNYTYSKEDKLIGDLKKANYEKFDILKSIIKREIKKSEKLKKDASNIFDNNLYTKISNDNIDDIKLYNTSLTKYNDAFKKSAKALVNPEYFNTNDLEQTGKNIISNVKNTLTNYENNVKESSDNYENNYLAQNTNNSKNYYAGLTNTNTNTSSQTCSSDTSNYSRKYEGIYIIQEEGGTKISYKLFDYLDDLNGDEVTLEIDFDLDSDSDLLYSSDGNLYLKENLLNKDTGKIYLSGVEVLDIDDNKFINGDIYYESIDNASESFISNEFININFLASKRSDINNYRLEYYSIIDKYLNEGNNSYNPKYINKNIVDAFSDIDNSTLIEENLPGIIEAEDSFVENIVTTRKNLAYIYEVGNNIPKVTLKTKELINLGKISIDGNNNYPIIGSSRKLFTGDSSAVIYYYEGNYEELKELKIKAYTNVEFSNGIKINEIRGNVYIKTNKNIEIKSNEIYNYKGLPLSIGSVITNIGEFNSSTSSHVGIRYYDDSELNIDFRKINYYTLYDLGFSSDDYSITLSVDNDYLYSRMQVFKNNIYGTKTNQILLSPQKESDRYAPEINFDSKIRIPVYQEKIIDLTDSIYEDSGLENIDTLIIEGINKDKYEILHTSNKLRIKFNRFENIFSKKVTFIISDNNGNKSLKEVDFEVYSPIPEVKTYDNSSIKGVIDENLTNEPINIYRYRGGVIKRLETSSGSTKVDTINGNFDFTINTMNSNLIDITIDDRKIFSINEYTGKINLSSILYNIKATINDDNFIEINVLNALNEVVFSEIINGNFDEVSIVKSFSDLEENGLYLKLTSSDFDSYVIPDSAEYNPGSVAIYRKTDPNKYALFVVLPDSRIKIINERYKVDYSYIGDYIILKFMDIYNDNEIGQLLLKIDNSYVIK